MQGSRRQGGENNPFVGTQLMSCAESKRRREEQVSDEDGWRYDGWGLKCVPTCMRVSLCVCGILSFGFEPEFRS